MFADRSKSPAFTYLDADGSPVRQQVLELPFRIGRQSGNHLLLRDARASRNHAQLTLDDGNFILEDLQSRHGLFVNGEPVRRASLNDGDRVEFGFPDSPALVFERPGSRVAEIAEHFTDPNLSTHSGNGGNLARLRAVLEVARALQSSFSVDAVLGAVVDAALVITNAERGFLLLQQEGELQVRCARSRTGPLHARDLEVPRNLIRKSLEERAETFSMQFDPAMLQLPGDPGSSAYQLELKSVVCIPLVRIQMRGNDSEPLPTGPADAIGVLYMDSRVEPRDMAAGNRELLETLGMEASTVLENARLLEEERARQHLQEELTIARGIQQSLLPANLPESGWLRAAGYSMPSRQVGGDYYDVLRLGEKTWAVVVADVAGKGLSSALVSALLQGALLATDEDPQSMQRAVQRLDAFFRERAQGQKYATVFSAIVHAEGTIDYINAGHCAPVLVPLNGPVVLLNATSPPVGLLSTELVGDLQSEHYSVSRRDIYAGDRLVIYTDGLTDAQNADGELFGQARFLETIRTFADRPCSLLHQAILDNVESFMAGQEQADDLTLVVLEYRPD